MSYHLKETPVAFFIFNRIDVARKVFDKIKEARPPKLFVIADGPRSDHPGEAEQCRQCRDLIREVDWECDVFTNFSDINLGCGLRPKTGYDWVFSNVSEAIFLEDDCLPNNDFFHFCEELLIKYRNDTRISLIGGTNFQPVGADYLGASYYFSKIPQTWGWASWKRVWDTYDYDIKLWPEINRKGLFRSFLLTKKDEHFWNMLFEQLYYKRDSSIWDTQFLFNMWINNGLCILPTRNMVSHIGFEGTHIKGGSSYLEDSSSLSGRPVYDIEFPLRHPAYVMPDYQLDQTMWCIHNRGFTLKNRLKYYLRHLRQNCFRRD